MTIGERGKSRWRKPTLRDEQTVKNAIESKDADTKARKGHKKKQQAAV